MSLLFADSFDHYDTPKITRKWTTIYDTNAGPTAPLISNTGRNGTSSMRFVIQQGALGSGTLKVVTKTPTTSSNKFLMGFAYQYDSVIAGFTVSRWPIATVATMAYHQVTLIFNADSTLSVVGNFNFPPSNIVTLGTTSISLQQGVYNDIEWGGTIDPTNGSVYVYINGVLALNLTGIKTQWDNSTFWSQIFIGFFNPPVTNWSATGPGNVTWDYDDFWLCDGSGAHNNTAPIGPLRIVDLNAITGNGFHADSTPLTGSNRGDMVKEIPPDDDTTYNALASSGNTDTYFVAPLTISGTIVGVQSYHCARVDSGSHSIRTLFRIGGVDYEDGATTGLSSTYADALGEHDISPASGSAWTVAEINGAGFQVGPRNKT
jgi:hypothetical protein